MVFKAVATSNELSDGLVYKGARVLALRLGGMQRASYDLDANILLSFAEKYPSRDEQAAVLQDLLTQAIGGYCEIQNPVRYELESVKVVHRPRKDHPMGWNAFDVKARLRDFQNEGVLALPGITFDIAAPEELGAHATAPLDVDGETVIAYTVERIAGEKMRAFLSSLSTYRKKVKKPAGSARVKDLYDLSIILTATPIDDEEFWTNAGEEFRLACESRYIDCTGIETFSEELDVTRATFEADSTLPKGVGFDAAWSAVTSVMTFWHRIGIIPFEFQLPPSESDTSASP